MTEQAHQLINRLRKATSRFEALGLVTLAQEELKSKFEAKGLRFNPESSYDPQGFEGRQHIRDRDYDDYQAYLEINFIRHGLTTGWYDRLDAQERYFQIQEEVENIVSGLQ